MAVGELLQAGKIRHWGLSNETTFGERPSHPL
jgi:aryl-alcohol dehydrogenase-like predicted oxidoreductase